MEKPRFVPRRRAAADGVVWWCIYDRERLEWSTYLCHSKSRLKKEAMAKIKTGRLTVSENAKT